MMLPEAIRCAQRGWKVFPVEPLDKTPHKLNPDKPYTIKWSEVATSDIQKVVKLWSWSPTANIGIACAPSGLFVVDCDMPKREYQLRGTPYEHLHEKYGAWVDGSDVYRELCRKLEIPWDEANNTYRVCTGSMGCHYYYSWPTDRKASQASIVQGIVDVRGNGGNRGGYVLGPSSQTNKGFYVAENALPVAPAPAALVEYCTEGAREVVSPDVQRFIRPGGTGSIAGLETAVLTAPEGDRNATLLWAARAACNDGIKIEETIETLGAAYVANCGDGGYRQAESTIRSAYRLQSAKMPGT
jgi:hypothetical protein